MPESIENARRRLSYAIPIAFARLVALGIAGYGILSIQREESLIPGYRAKQVFGHEAVGAGLCYIAIAGLILFATGFRAERLIFIRLVGLLGCAALFIYGFTTY